MIRVKTWFCLVSVLSVLAVSQRADAVPPAHPNDKGLNPLVNILDANILFDSTFDSSGGTDPSKITPDGQAILLAHKIAQQQAQLAIEYLEANREQILAGTDSNFNSVFGNIGELRPVAILAPSPVRGIGDVATADPYTVTADNDTAPGWTSQLRKGDWIYVGEPASLTPALSTRVVQISSVVGDSDGDNQEIRLNRRGSGVAEALTGVPIYRVLGFDMQPDPGTFRRILETFKAIRRGLGGVDAADSTVDVFSPNANMLQRDITYRGNFTDFNNVWTAGQGDVTFLNSLLSAYPGYTADRALRQAGFSNADSALHIVNLDTMSNTPGTLPLLWTQDNGQPLTYLNPTTTQLNGGVLPVGSAPPAGADLLRDFFQNRQTLFSDPDNVFVQYVGNSFLTLVSGFDADFFDNSIAGAAPRQDVVLATNSTGVIIRNNQGVPSWAVVTVPGTSNPFTAGTTEFAQWQLIIESFAEHTTDFTTIDNVAARGVMELLGGTGRPEFRAWDAGNYARFSNLITVPSGGLSNIEPFGRRATAGFNPVVPRF